MTSPPADHRSFDPIPNLNERSSPTSVPLPMLDVKPAPPPPPSGPLGALFSLGFRPFFLGAAWLSIAFLGLWVVAYAGGRTPATIFGNPLYWHQHEMLFGYTLAVIAGFLLTAVINWTDLPTVSGGKLMAVFGLWLAGRLVPFFPELVPFAVAAAIDIAFLPVVAVVIAIPIMKKRLLRNMGYAPLLLGLTAANACFYLSLAGKLAIPPQRPMVAAIWLVLVVIAVVGGRVIPFFARTAIPRSTVKVWKPIEALSIGTVLGIAVLEIFGVSARAIAPVAVLAGIVHTIRLAGWHVPQIWRVPLLWVLYLGYAWIVLGLFLYAAAANGLVLPAIAVHALTGGGIGVLTLGMMARVTLGHTGRAMQSSRATDIAFVLINLAAVCRVLLPLVAMEHYKMAIHLSGTLWIAAFLLFAFVHTPMLVRADHRA